MLTTKIRGSRRFGFLFSALAVAACANAEGTPQRTPPKKPTVDAVTAPIPALTPEQRKTYLDAAALAWKYFDKNTSPTTGLTSATPNWLNTTLWDIGAELLATYSAKELG